MAVSTRSTLAAVFPDRDKAQRAVNELRQAGFRDDQIGMMARDDRTGEGITVIDKDTKVPEGAAVGAAAGAGAGLLWALGIVAGVVPPLGPVIAGGVLASVVLSTAGVAAVGGLVGALVGAGIPEEEAHHYQQEIQAGRYLITVKADERHDEAAAILQRCGGAYTDPHLATPY